jgi:predicted membrane-bound spermidine synthase
MLHLIAVVALAGAGTMTVELAAVRVLAPWFGTSSRVWTNVIGVVLLALALGYLLGARLSRTGNPRRRLGTVLLVAAACSAWLPFAARPIAEAFLPANLALDQAAAQFVWGSLAASLLLFLPTATALGCVGPLAVEELARLRHGGAGDAGGRVLAASTLGSLAGTFATTHVFIPEAGLRWTFLGAGLLLGVCGLSMLLPRPNGTGGAAAALVLLGLPFSSLGPRQASAERALIEVLESPYQHLEVVEVRDETGAPRARWLQVNESFDSYQSVWQPEPGLLGDGYYYDYFAPPAHWAGATGTWRVLVLGLGAGTAVRVLEGTLPDGLALDSVGVEIDPGVVDLGVRWFELEVEVPGRTVISDLDGRAALRALPGPFDQVVLDCYANNMEIPAHLATVEFFREVREVLRPGGWISANVGGFGVTDPVVAAVAETLAEGLGERVSCARVPFSRNVMLYARREGTVAGPGEPGFTLHDGLAHLTPPLEVPGAWREVSPGGTGLLTDDWSPIDRLQLASISAGRRRFLAR